ncbi:hypothetical protein M5D96_003166 [Drosophila gunungcola]|uniref:Uncharacterized protein n=1 Tax=Drosophila gunungcola TaxID=103775 RepID=A0A9Q0BRV2_9MUSC|nr:hypothetical protein M5D96_003166 [Drosophila gunungcola]
MAEHVNDDDDSKSNSNSNSKGSCSASPPACIIIIKHTDAHSRIGDRKILLDGQGQPRGMRRCGESRGIAPQAVLKASTQISSKV